MEHIQHLFELRKRHQRNIQILELQIADQGINAPLVLRNELEAERIKLSAVEAQLSEPVGADVLEELTTGGQTALIMREVRVTRQLLTEKGDRDRTEMIARLDMLSKKGDQDRQDLTSLFHVVSATIAHEQSVRFWSVVGIIIAMLLMAIAGFVYMLIERFFSIGMILPLLRPLLISPLMFQLRGNYASTISMVLYARSQYHWLLCASCG